MLIDSHIHFDFFDAPQRAQQWQRAQAAGVSQLMIPAVEREQWPRIAEICKQEGFLPAYGLHPIYLDKHRPEDIAALDAFIRHHPCYGIGECGLDYYLPLDKARQRHYFAAQIEIALAHDLALTVHARKSLDDVLNILKAYSGVRFVIHSFTGSDQQLERLLLMGGYIGIGGTVTYPRAQRLRRQLSAVPSDRYLLETDAPDQPLCGNQGQYNEPMRVAEVAIVLAELRRETPARIAADSSRNFQRLFLQE